MLPNTTGNISDGTSNHVYDLREIGSGRSTRVETAAPLDQPAMLVISHQDSGTGIKARRSSLVKFTRVVEDADGNQDTVECQAVIRIPVKIATTAQATAALTELLSFFALSTYKTQWLNGEI